LLDWITAEIPLLHKPMQNGLIASINQDGTIEWESPRRLEVSGSHSSKFQVKSIGGDGEGNATHLYIHGNPTKYLQGHNVFGLDDLVGIVRDAVCQILVDLDLQMSSSELQALITGDYDVKRIDVNYLYELPSNSDVNTWIRAAEFTSKTRHGRPTKKGGTVYWGQNSRRWSVKAYNKYEELQKHQIPESLDKAMLEGHALGKLRLEVVLRRKELETLNLPKASQIQKYGLRALYETYIQRIEMTQQIRLSDKKFRELPQRLKSTYVLWQHGEDVKETLSNATFYRHRKELLGYGIDVSVMRPKKSAANIVPLIRILEAKECPIPEWAYEKGLVHKPSRIAS